MEKLSVELFHGILCHLELTEQIKLRRVCKDWMLKIDSLEKSLTISSASRPASYRYGLWNPVQDYVRTATINAALGLLKKQTLSNLKSLCVYKLDVGKKSGRFCKAVSFDQLDVLTLSSIENLDKVVNLRLPSVRRIFIGYLQIETISLDAQKLEDVKIRFGEVHFDLQFVHSSVRCIELDEFSKCLESAQLKKSLQRIYCQKIGTDVGDAFLKDFNRLEELHFNHNRQAFGILFEQKKKYCANLKIYFNGLHVDSLSEFKGWFNGWFDDQEFQNRDSGQTCNKELLDLYVRNYSRLADRLPFYTNMNYQQIEDLVPRLPRDFFRRLVNMYHISTCKPVKNVKGYLNFLRENFKNLTELGVLIDLQPQIFFNLLPLCVPGIRSMMITGDEVDVNFIFGLKDLVVFSCSIEFSDSFIRKVYAELKSIETLSFKYGRRLIFVVTKEPNVFHLKVGCQDGSEPKFNNVNALIGHLKSPMMGGIPFGDIYLEILNRLSM